MSKLYATYQEGYPEYTQAEGSLWHCVKNVFEHWLNTSVLLKIRRIW